MVFESMCSKGDTHSRKNGFESPHDNLQLMVWVVTLTVSLLSIAISILLFSKTTSILFNIVFDSLLVYHLVVHFRVLSVDPRLPEDVAPAVEDKRCYECQKHVEKWDHHCFFLNTCIGRPNYWYFVQTVFSGFFLAAFNTVVQASFIFLYIIYGWRTGVELFPAWLLAMITLATGLSTAVVFQSGHLYYFHSWILYPLGSIATKEFFRPKKALAETKAGTTTSSKPSFDGRSRASKKLHDLHELMVKTLATDTNPDVMEEYMEYAVQKRRETPRGRDGATKTQRRRSRSRSRSRLMSTQNVQFKSHKLRL